MHLGLVIYGDLSQQSGGYMYDRSLVRFLRAQGDDIEVLSQPAGRYMQNLNDNRDRRLFDTIVGERFNILLQDELNHPSLFSLNRKLKKRSNAPIIAIVHHLRASERHPRWQQSIYRRIERRYLQTVDGFIFNSPQTRENVQSLLGSSADGVVGLPGRDHISPNLTPRQIRQRALLPGPLRVLFVGSIIPRKRVLDILEALALLPEDEWKLDIFGSQTDAPEYVKRLGSTMDRLGLAGSVRLHGFQPQGVIEEAMRASHLLVMPSEHEGFGIAYLEAMGFGLPTIGSPDGGAASIIQEGVNGYLLAAGDPELLSKKIGELNQNRELLASMGVSAMERFARHPTWEDTGQAIRTYLRGQVGSMVLE